LVRDLTSYQGYLFDVDGTLLYPNDVVPGADRALTALRAAGKKLLAVTNNSSARRHDLAERFRQHGLPLSDQEVFSALIATAQLVAHEKPGANVLVFGNKGLVDELTEAGLRPVESENPDYLVVGNNHGGNYESLGVAMRALLNGARFVAVNADRMYVGPTGQLIPGAGAWVAALERSSGRSPDAIVGKPSARILVEAAQSLGLQPADCIYVGDNLDVDVGGAYAAGMDALLVHTGVSKPGDRAEREPEHILASVAELGALFG
jgi:HAD superfamily hydrolase (TIGR01450 family)